MIQEIGTNLRQWLDYWQNPYLRMLIVLFATIVVAHAVRMAFSALVHLATRRTATEVDDRIVEAFRTPVFVSIILTGVTLAVGELEPGPRVDFVLHGLIKSAAVVVWGMACMNLGSYLLNIMGQREDRFRLVQPATLPLFQITLKLVVLGGIIYFAFISWGIDVTGWLASAGIVGIAVGFAAKDTLANLFAGIFIVTDAPYKLGDFIVLDDGTRGQVTNIGIRSTRILTRDDIELTIPNAIIANSRVVNESGGGQAKRRIRIPVGVAYGSDVEQVRRILLECTVGVDHVSHDPPPRCHFVAFGESSLDFQLKVWITEPVYKGQVTDALNTRIYRALNEAAIEIPFPKRDVYIKELPSKNGPSS